MTDFYLYRDINNKLANDIATIPDNDITLHINSGGGDVFAGIAIYNLLKSKNTTVIIEGVCASAATIIACAAIHIKAAKTALFFIHLPFVTLFANYNTDDLQKLKNVLEAIQNSILLIYQNRTGKSQDELNKLMKDETWFNADDMLANRFIDEIIDSEVSNSMPDTDTTKNETTKNEAPKLIMDKLKNSIVQMERQRVKNLVASKGDNPYVNSIIDAAITDGRELSEIAPYIDAVKNVPADSAGLKEFMNNFNDNQNSGADKVTASTPPPSDEQKAANQADLIAQFANKILGVNL